MEWQGLVIAAWAVLMLFAVIFTGVKLLLTLNWENLNLMNRFTINFVIAGKVMILFAVYVVQGYAVTINTKLGRFFKHEIDFANFLSGSNGKTFCCCKS